MDTEILEMPQLSSPSKDESLDSRQPPISLTNDRKSVAQQVIEAPVGDSQQVTPSEEVETHQYIGSIDTPEQALNLLGIKPGSSPDQIRKAYIKLAWKYHPDTSSLPDATERFQEINKARDLLDSQETQDPASTGKLDLSELQKKIQEASADQIISGLLEDPQMKDLLAEVDHNPSAKIDGVAMDAQKGDGSFGWSETMSILLFLMLDISLNNGHGISSLLEKFIDDKVTTNLLIPVLKNCGMSEEDIEQLIEHRNETGKAVFQLSPSILRVTLEGMSKDQLRDTVSSLDPEDQKKLLFSKGKRAPNDKLSEDEIEKYFNKESLGEDYLTKLRTKLGITEISPSGK